MRAWLIDDFTGVQALHLADVPDPVPGTGEVILSLDYAALNPADRYLAERLYPAKPHLPHILGRDGMGTVIQMGPGVTQLKPGDRRAVLRSDIGVNRAGTFAQRVAVPADALVEIPSGWNEAQAGCATLVYLTAFQALTMWGPLPAEPVVLVTGASGGVGIASIQLARAMGCTVVALSRSAEKREQLRQLGATVTVDPQQPDWRESAKKAIAPRRVNIAVDNIGGKLLPEVIDTLGDLGKVSVVGRLAGPVPEFNTAILLFKRLRIGGVAVGAYTGAEARAAWKEVTELLARTGAKPVVDKVFEFGHLPQAFERLKEGPMGKVLVKIGSTADANG